MKENLLEALALEPIVAAAKSEEEFERCLTCKSKVVFLLFGDVCTVGDLVERVKSAGKIAVVDLDLVEGLAAKNAAVDYITSRTRADGIISTKSAVIRYAKGKDLWTIQRYFLLDSRVLENIALNSSTADIVEVLPGAIPKIIRHLADTTGKPIIASGLILDKEDVAAALSAGAAAISSTNRDVWFSDQKEGEE